MIDSTEGKKRFWKQNRYIILFSLMFLVMTVFFNDSLYGIFGEQNYLVIHLIIEVFIISIAFSIAIQSWMAFPNVLSSLRLWIGALFLAVGLIEVAHAITYKGMPLFLTESSAYKATWFFMVARLTEVIGMLVIVVFKDKLLTLKHRFHAYSLAIVYSLFWMFVIFSPTPLLPELVQEGIGTTILKNNLQYIGIFIELLIIYFVVVRFRSKEVFNNTLILASVHLIMADYFFTTYKSVFDINNFIGHLFQMLGFFFLLRGVYHTSVEEPYQKQKATKEQLKQTIIQQKKDQEIIQHMAFYDELTEIPNLRLLKENLTEIIRLQSRSRAAILVLDIDRFKKINNSLGHSFGDSLLQSIAKRLRDQLPKEMFLYRLTGDEFAIILSPLQQKDEVVAVIEQIQNLMKEPLQAHHLHLNVSMSIGVALYPKDGTNAEELLKHANLTLMEAQLQNSPYLFYQNSMEGKGLERLVFENDLYRALSNDELFVVYQPQMDIDTGKILGLEALLRWHHPKHGLISPATFIPIAEENGLIIPIGEWVLRTACRQIKQWHDLGLPQLVISVNLSIRQFYQQDLVGTVKEILIENQLSPEYLELEITESIIMNVEHTMETLQALKSLGIIIAIDDFGTGYSSLSYLKHLPVDRLKIDQSFVRDLLNDEDDTTIVSTIISMARHLNLDVIAEGVETSKQKDILFAQQCKRIQGYYFSQPLKAKDFLDQFTDLQNKAKECIGMIGEPVETGL